MKTVLIVDDSEFIRNALYKIMNQEGLRVIGMAVNGLEAIDKFNALTPDIITFDISMPVLNGLKAIKMIRAISGEVQIVVISSVSAEENVLELYKAGANFFIAKPFDTEDIVGVLKQIS